MLALWGGKKNPSGRVEVFKTYKRIRVQTHKPQNTQKGATWRGGKDSGRRGYGTAKDSHKARTSIQPSPWGGLITNKLMGVKRGERGGVKRRGNPKLRGKKVCGSRPGGLT